MKIRLTPPRTISEHPLLTGRRQTLGDSLDCTCWHNAAAKVFLVWCDKADFPKKLCCREKRLSTQHVAWNSTELNSCFIWSRNKISSLFNVTSCALPISQTAARVHSLCIVSQCNMSPLPIHEGACSCFISSRAETFATSRVSALGSSAFNLFKIFS